MGRDVNNEMDRNRNNNSYNNDSYNNINNTSEFAMTSVYYPYYIHFGNPYVTLKVYLGCTQLEKLEHFVKVPFCNM